MDKQQSVFFLNGIEVSKEAFERYRKLQDSSSVDMAYAGIVTSLANITKAEHGIILRHYSAIKKFYNL